MRGRTTVLLMVATVILAVIVPMRAANAVTTFCNGYSTWDIPHITPNLKYKSCITYYQNGANYNVRAYGYAYIDSCGSTCQSHVDGFVLSDKLERPLGTVVASNPCDFATEAVSSPGAYCEVTIQGVSDPGSYYSSLRVTIFYTDGHSAEQSPKLCQRGTGPNNTC
jgi:hypothetical protein